MVGVDVEDADGGAGRCCGFQYPYRQIAEPDNFLDGLPCGAVFAGQVALLVVEEPRGFAVDSFTDTLAYCIVGVAGGEVYPRGADSPSLGIVAVGMGAIAGQVA